MVHCGIWNRCIAQVTSQITSVSVVCWTVYSGADQRLHQSSASLAFVRGIHRWPVNSRTKGQSRWKCFHLMTLSCHLSLVRPVRLFFQERLLMTLTCFVGTPRDFATSSILFCTAPSVALLGTTEGVFAAVWVLTAVWTKKSICRLSAVVFLSVITTSLALWKKTKLCSTIRSCSLDVGSLLTYWCLWKWQTFGRRYIQINVYKRKLTYVF